MTAVLVKGDKRISVELKSAEHEPMLHLYNKVEGYIINGIDMHIQHSKKQ